MQQILHSSATAATRRIVSDLIRQYSAGVPFDADVVLGEHPELLQRRSVVIELAYEEYCRRVDAGQKVAPAEFLDRFPTIHRSLRRLLEVHKFLHGHCPLPDAEEDAGWPQIGETVLGFDILDELGRGAFSRVFLAAEPGLGNRTIALKICRGGCQEAHLLGTLQHPNIVPVYSVQTDSESGLTAICMPYLGRATLCDLLDVAFQNGSAPKTAQSMLEAVSAANEQTAPAANENHPASRILRTSYVDLIAQVGAELAEALSFTHEKGFCHGDVKPSNVLLTSSGRALLFDFNLSYVQQGDRSVFGGTLPYMAPELLQTYCAGEHQNPEPADGRSDIFSLAVVLYELLCGVHPFGTIPVDLPRDQIAEHLLRRQRQGPRPISHFNKEVDSRTARLIQSCLSYSPSGRPTRARELAVALRRQLSAGRRFIRWFRAHRRITIGLAALVLSLVLCLGAAWATYVPSDIREFRLGKTAYLEARYEDAIDSFSGILINQPTHAGALRYRGRCYLQQRQFKKALEDFSRFTKAGGNSQDVEAEKSRCHSGLAALHYDSGRSLFREKHYEQAEKEFSRALKRLPAHHAARFQRGRSRMLSGSFDAAIEDFKSIPPELADPRLDACIGYCRAASIFQHGQSRDYYIAPLEYFEKSFGPGVSAAAVDNDIAFCYIQMRRYASAKERLNRAIAEDPKQLTAHFLMAKILRLPSARKNLNGGLAALGDILKAINHIQEAIRLADENRANAEATGDVPTRELHFEAACIFSTAARFFTNVPQEANYLKTARRHCRYALESGLDRARLDKIRSINPAVTVDLHPPEIRIPEGGDARSRTPIGLVDPVSNVDDELSFPQR